MNDSPEEIFKIAVQHAKGLEVPQNHTEAFRLLNIASELGHARATASVGWHYENGIAVSQSIPKAIEYYRKAAERDESFAQYNLGRLLYESGQYAESLPLFRRAAEQGITLALVFLGIAYNKGNGVDQNLPRAFQFFREASKKGDLNGTFHLALCYREGRGVEKDFLLARKLFESASDRDDPRAWNELGCMYRTGEIHSPEPEKTASASSP